jgi:hypothetical protein
MVAGIPDHRGQAGPGPDGDLLPVELHASQASLQLDDEPPDALVPDQDVVPAAQDHDRQLLLVGEQERLADVVHVLGEDEDVPGAAAPE